MVILREGSYLLDRIMKKIAIQTKGIQRSLDYYKSGSCGTRMLFSIAELQQMYDAKLFNLNTLWKTTLNFMTTKCDVVHILDFLPIIPSIPNTQVVIFQ